MPTYEYICKNCGENFEVFQSFADRPLKKHKTCGGDLKKVLHARGIVFKGSGFYATDAKGTTTDNGADKGDTTSDVKPKPPSKDKPDKKPAAATTD